MAGREVGRNAMEWEGEGGPEDSEVRKLEARIGGACLRLLLVMMFLNC